MIRMTLNIIIRVMEARSANGMNAHRISRSMIIGIAVGLLTVVSTSAETTISDNMAQISAGEFEMGDHHDLGGAEHRSDEVPLHTVYVDSFAIGKTEITTQQYVEYLNSALSQGMIEVKNGFVYGVDGDDIYCEIRQAVSYSRVGWDGRAFSVLGHKEQHPMIGIRWLGAAAYTNWLSIEQGYEACYDLASGTCDFSKKGFRLPTEAEWEYAGRGGQYGPYFIFPWGNDDDLTKANWPKSGDPYELGPLPWTTPVGFYNGQFHQKTDFGWPGSQASYQSADGSNGYGLYDMAGNVWEWTHDWYNREYYSMSPSANPQGPDRASPMPDGRSYHTLRGGSWYNGQWGHSRVANRNPAHYRGPDDPNHAWYHIGFRVVLDLNGNARRSGGEPQNIESRQPQSNRPSKQRVERTAAYETCITNTSGEPDCKNCCDCMDADPGQRKACRDECATHDFSQNTNIISIEVPSILGRNGDYSACTSGESAQACKECCESSPDYACGDRQSCRKACDKLDPSRDRPPRNNERQAKQRR